MTTTSSSGLKLVWSPNKEKDFMFYRVYRSTTRGVSASLDTLIAEPTQNTYFDVGLKPGTAYFYRVAAVNNSGEGEKSTEVDGITESP